MPAATLTSKGQLVVPKAIRERLGLQTGDRLDFLVQDDGNVTIRLATEDVTRLKGILHHPERRSVTVDEMRRIIRRRGSKVR